MDKNFVGRKIVAVRHMTKAELEAEGWDTNHQVPLLELDNGDKLYPSCDEEGNGPGELFVTDKNGKAFMCLWG